MTFFPQPIIFNVKVWIFSGNSGYRWRRKLVQARAVGDFLSYIKKPFDDISNLWSLPTAWGLRLFSLFAQTMATSFQHSKSVSTTCVSSACQMRQFHTPVQLKFISSTRNLNTNASVPHVSSTQMSQFHKSVQHKCVSSTRQFNTNASVLLLNWRICVELTNLWLTDAFVLNWRICVELTHLRG